MTDDELKALIESNARSNAANSDAIAELTAAGARTEQSLAEFIEHADSWLEALRNSADDSAGEVQANSQRITENENRFNILLAEAQQDRLEADADRAENARRFDEMTARADADRQRSDQRFDAQLAEIRAQGEQIRALLSALATTNGRVDGLEQAG